MAADGGKYRWIAAEYGAQVSYPARLLDQPRQRRALFQRMVRPPAGFEPAPVRAWDGFLKDDLMEPRNSAETWPSAQDNHPVVAWLHEVQRLTAYLLLRSCIPCFDPILVASVTERHDQADLYEAIFEMPLLTNYLGSTVPNAFAGAAEVLSFIAGHAPDAENREHLWSDMGNRIIPHIASTNRVNASTIQVLHAAYKDRLPFAHVGQGIYRIGWGAAGRLVSASTTERDSVIGNKLSGRKELTARVLRDAGLPAPRHVLASTVAYASQAAERLGWPVVIKPADLDRGEGVTVDVDAATIGRAAEHALELSPTSTILVEQQVPGVCHRLFIVDGKLLYAVKRLPIGVYGDGTRTVRDLVNAAWEDDQQRAPWHRTKIRPIDDLARAALSNEGLSEDAVPEKGRFVPLRRIESTAWGGVDEDVSHKVHTDNLKAAIDATRVVGLSVAGVDIITSDISKSWTEHPAIINEVNYSPLLGGGDISRQHVPLYVNWLLDGNGRIPVAVFAGAHQAMEAARAHVERLRQEGVAAVLTSDDLTLDAAGHAVPLDARDLAGRVRALCMSRDVEALALVVQSDSLLNGPLPLECVDAVEVFDDLSSDRQARLVATLKRWVRRP